MTAAAENGKNSVSHLRIQHTLWIIQTYYTMKEQPCQKV